eukprot:11173813-Lingulodinium_polyedra.AAC.1
MAQRWPVMLALRIQHPSPEGRGVPGGVGRRERPGRQLLPAQGGAGCRRGTRGPAHHAEA